MDDYSDPAAYWDERLARDFDLTGVGHAGLGLYYNRQLYRARIRSLERGLETIAFAPAGASVLELGCGTGFYAEYCQRRGAKRYVGIDIAASSIERLSADYPDFTFIQADIGSTDLPFTDDFDFVVRADVLYHIIDDSQFKHAVHELSKAVKPGEIVAIADVFPPMTVQTGVYVRLRGESTYLEYLQEYGLAADLIEPIFCLLQPPIPIPGHSRSRGAYYSAWRILRQLMTWMPVEVLMAEAFTWLDDHVFMPLSGSGRYAVKWLLASRHNEE
jgi:SAM-dependent methyltransferase